MGDRGNIVVRSSQNNTDDVWFYTHWSGSEIGEVVQRALAKKWRWGDTSYLARIIFDELTDGNHGDESGFGISTQIQDNSHPILVVDDDKQRVFTVPANMLVSGRIPSDYDPIAPQSYEQFISQME